MSEAIAEAEFEKAADRELRALARVLDALDAEIEADLESGILTIEFTDGVKYVVNSHRAARQIWMAAERNAWHFDPTPSGAWRATKTGDELWSALAGALGRKLGRAIELGRPS